MTAGAVCGHRERATAGRDDDARRLLHELAVGDFAAISPPERPHSIGTLADVACRLGDRITAAALRTAMTPSSGLVVYDGTNGPLLPVDSFITRLGRTALAGDRGVQPTLVSRLA